jgi:hypothetical protein
VPAKDPTYAADGHSGATGDVGGSASTVSIPALAIQLHENDDSIALSMVERDFQGLGD